MMLSSISTLFDLSESSPRMFGFAMGVIITLFTLVLMIAFVRDPLDHRAGSARCISADGIYASGNCYLNGEMLFTIKE